MKFTFAPQDQLIRLTYTGADGGGKRSRLDKKGRGDWPRVSSYAERFVFCGRDNERLKNKTLTAQVVVFHSRKLLSVVHPR